LWLSLEGAARISVPLTASSARLGHRSGLDPGAGLAAQRTLVFSALVIRAVGPGRRLTVSSASTFGPMLPAPK
jgi:hypothetical protein